MSPRTLYILRNLASRPFMTTIVLIAMMAVGAAITGVAGVTSGLRRAFASRGHDNRVIVLSRDARSEAQSGVPVGALGAITVHPEVKRASPEVLIRSLVHRKTGGVDPITLRGVEPQGFAMHEIAIVQGRMPEKGASEIIIGENLLQRLPWAHIGATIDMLNDHFVCVGVFRSSTYYSGEVWTTRSAILSDAKRLALSVVYLETDSRADAESLAQTLRNDRAVQVDAISEPQLYARLIGDQSHLEQAMLLIGLLVVGGALFAASSFLSLMQQGRISELCMLRAIGYRTRAIASLVLWETELMALLGGGLGVATAALVLRDYTVQSVGETTAPAFFSARLEWPVIAGTVALLFVVGIIGALVPIFRATHATITQGLREE